MTGAQKWVGAFWEDARDAPRERLARRIRADAEQRAAPGLLQARALGRAAQELVAAPVRPAVAQAPRLWIGCVRRSSGGGGRRDAGGGRIR